MPHHSTGKPDPTPDDEKVGAEEERRRQQTEERSPDIEPPLQIPADQQGEAGTGPVGISNRSLKEEEQAQRELPPRFTRKRESA